MQSSRELAAFGVQQKAVLLSLQLPRTGKHILRIALLTAPKLTYYDLRHILRDFEKRKYIQCLNTNEKTGRIYKLTRLGNQLAIHIDSSFKQEPLPAGIDWNIYARVCRSNTLESVLLQLSVTHFGTERKTPTQIRKQLLEKHPMSLSLTIRAITSLVKTGLVCSAMSTSKDGRLSYYTLTPKGRVYVGLLSL